MENYSENTATAKTWKRANRFEVLNGYGATPKINIVEETIVEIGGLSVNKFNGMLTVDYLSFETKAPAFMPGMNRD